MYVKLIS